MFKREKNKGQKVPVEEEWIEMEDLSAPHNQNISKKFAQLEGKQYTQPINKNPPELSQTISKTNKNISSSSNSESPSKIQSYTQKENEPRFQPSLPMMEVTCDFCTVAQRVPGNTQVYCCGSCENMNQCYPLYGVILCGCCQTNVGFGFGMSEHIRCPKCSSVNRVPLEPVKQYQSISIMGVQQISERIQNRHRQVERQDRHDFVEYEDLEYVEFESRPKYRM